MQIISHQNMCSFYHCCAGDRCMWDFRLYGWDLQALSVILLHWPGEYNEVCIGKYDLFSPVQQMLQLNIAHCYMFQQELPEY